METSFTAGVYDELGVPDLSSGAQADYAEVDDAHVSGVRTESAYVEPRASMLLSPTLNSMPTDLRLPLVATVPMYPAPPSTGKIHLRQARSLL